MGCIERGGGLTGRSDQKAHAIQPNHIAGDVTLGLPEKCRPAAILHQGIAHDHSVSMAADHDSLKKTSGNHVSLQPHIRLAGN